jgi:hypothetical protein
MVVGSAHTPTVHSPNRRTANREFIDGVRADQEVTLIRALHRTAIILLAVLTVTLTGFVLLVARSVTRLIRQRESQMREASTLLQQRNQELDAFFASSLQTPNNTWRRNGFTGTTLCGPPSHD